MKIDKPLPPLSKSLSSVVDAVRQSSTGHLALNGLSGSAASLVLATLSRCGMGPLMVVTADTAASEALTADLAFFGLSRQDGLLSFPDWDVHPYDGLSPHIDVHVDRIAALAAMKSASTTTVLVCPVSALRKRVIKPEALDAASLAIEVGGTVDPTHLGEHLSRAGYLSTDMVLEAASFSTRGGIVDFFPPAHDYPIRIELWGDEVESIREFDPGSQRSVRQLKRIVILPTREETLLAPQVDSARFNLRRLSSDRDLPIKHRRRLTSDIAEGLHFPNIEYFLPALHPELGSVFDHLPSTTRVVLMEPARLTEQLRGSFEKIRERAAELMLSEPLLPEPTSLFMHEEDILNELDTLPGIVVSKAGLSKTAKRAVITSEPTAGIRQTILSHRGEGMLSPVVERVSNWAKKGMQAYVTCHSEAQANRLADMFHPYGLRVAQPQKTRLSLFLNPQSPDPESPALVPVLGSLSSGFTLPHDSLALLAEEDILGPRQRTITTSRQFLKNAIDSFSQLKIGDFVVHAVHGIGIFRGVNRVPVAGGTNDFVHIEFAKKDKLYLPVHRLHTLQRYVGTKGATPKLDKMGGQTWKKTTVKVKENVLKVARQLLDLYAARAVARGKAFSIDKLALEEFEAAFPYEETSDQLEAIHSVLQDMASPKPMDRLICGDVGYGKTEVALRAAWVAVMNGCQVAVVVPTTVLALQHFSTFRDRFADLPVNVAQMSRFVPKKTQKEVQTQLASGGVDIVVGTHRLFSETATFKNLGLVIIDEEHKFGVRHKEKLKKIRRNIDAMTMTATPIPRTLHMATAGLRDLSIIATPPRDRVAIRTYVAPFSPKQIARAIQEELDRGGQVFFVHNRVQSIAAMARYLADLVPSAIFDMVHGQMAERKIESAMKRFIEGETNVLVTTSIVESGLDIPRANTIIINRADRLGLAQLYQLRGRVGRSNRRAFAYLLTPAGGPPTERAHRRLRALESHSELGAGFRIASEDLEMRGAGNLLGKNQSGSVAAVGFETYIELLHQAVQELSGHQVDDTFDPDVDIKVQAYVPEDYIPEFQQRLQLYRRLATAPNELSLASQAEELADMYGALPDPVKELLRTMEIRILARRLRVSTVKATSDQLILRFDPSTPMDRTKLARLATTKSNRYRLTPDGRLRVKWSDEEALDLPASTKKILRRLS